MKITLEEIWKMADLVEQLQEKSNVLSEQKKTTEKKTKTEERTLKLPKLQISENWGKENKVEREELQRIVDAATGKQDDAFKKLRAIQNQMEKLSTGSLGKIRNPARILSQIMILETLNRLFKSFQPSPAGFINEAFLSVFYGGVQTSAGEANRVKDIGDVTAPDGTPISIKTKGSKALIVDGSVENLYHSINKSGKVYFDIYEKVKEGSEEDEHIGILRVYRFIVDTNNINKFLGEEYFDVKDGKLVPRGKFKVGGRANNDSDEASLDEARKKKLTLDGVAELIVNSPSAMSKEELQQLVDTIKITKRGFNTLYDYLEQKREEARKTNKKQQFEKYHKTLQLLGSIQLAAIEPQTFGGSLEREFHISEVQWRPFAYDHGEEPIEITFSDQQLQTILQAAVEELDQIVVDIFNNLEGFTQSISAYLTSTARSRGRDGEKALKYAKELEPQTRHVVQKVSSDKEEA